MIESYQNNSEYLVDINQREDVENVNKCKYFKFIILVLLFLSSLLYFFIEIFSNTQYRIGKIEKGVIEYSNIFNKYYPYLIINHDQTEYCRVPCIYEYIDKKDIMCSNTQAQYKYKCANHCVEYYNKTGRDMGIYVIGNNNCYDSINSLLPYYASFFIVSCMILFIIDKFLSSCIN